LLSGYEGQHSPENYRKRDYYPLLSRLGIEKKTPHATRHTYATRAVKEGLPPEILQKVLGHADYSTTANIYTHIDPDTIVAAVTGTLLTKPESGKKKKP
jgi:integrase